MAPFSATGIASTTLVSDPERQELATVLRRISDGTAEPPSGSCVDEALAALSPSPQVGAIVAAMMRLTSITNAPDVADGRALLDQLRGALTRHSLYLDEGWGTIVEGLKSACERCGVSLKSKCRAQSIEKAGSWMVRLSNGNVIDAGSVILAVNPLQAAELHAPIATLPAMSSLVAAKVACLDLGVAPLPRPDLLFALGVDRPLYFSVHSAAARLAPDGASLIHVMRYLRPGERPDPTDVLAELEAYVDFLQPGWRKAEQARQFLPAMPVMSSIPLAASSGTSGRPDVDLPGVDGLLVAGDWVGPIGLLGDACASSARSAGEQAAAFAVERSKAA